MWINILKLLALAFVLNLGKVVRLEFLPSRCEVRSCYQDAVRGSLALRAAACLPTWAQRCSVLHFWGGGPEG